MTPRPAPEKAITAARPVPETRPDPITRILEYLPSDTGPQILTLLLMFTALVMAATGAGLYAAYAPTVYKSATFERITRECNLLGCQYFAFDGEGLYELSQLERLRLKTGANICVTTAPLGAQRITRGPCPISSKTGVSR